MRIERCVMVPQSSNVLAAVSESLCHALSQTANYKGRFQEIKHEPPRNEVALPHDMHLKRSTSTAPFKGWAGGPSNITNICSRQTVCGTVSRQFGIEAAYAL